MAERFLAPLTTMPDQAPILDQRLVHALAHPLRVQILNRLVEEVASPKELTDHLSASLSHVSYHVRQLEKYDAIELVRLKQRRGAVEHYFRATSKSFIGSPGWRLAPKLFLGLVGGASISSFAEKAVKALQAGRLADNREVFTWMPIVVDDRGKREVADFHDSAVDVLLAIQAKSKRRLARNQSAAIQYLVAVAGFEAAGS